MGGGELRHRQFQAQVTSLNLTGSQLDAPSCAALCFALRQNTKLHVLHLANNTLGTHGVTPVADLLAGECALRELDLAGNHLGAGGAQALAKALAKAPSSRLRVLDLRRNSSSRHHARATRVREAADSVCWGLLSIRREFDAS